MIKTKNLLYDAMYLIDELSEGCEDATLNEKIRDLMADWETWKTSNSGCYIYPEKQKRTESE